mmetsp:Transcript_38804/g.76933  ORF Transcript_38804/g.76933 Transcript_38804/m.76933 type:complete len:675 (-) Transcript_38804:55-2079(-)
MKLLIRTSALTLILSALPAATAISPVQKVLELLDALLVKGKEEKMKEERQLATYKQFCDESIAEKTRTVKDAEEAMTMLGADIEKYEADTAQLTEYIAKHDANLMAWGIDRKKASEVRKNEAADYAKMHQDYSESMAALKKAISSLKRGKPKLKADVKEKFVQVAALQEMSLIPIQTKEAVTSFLAGDEASLADEDADLSEERGPYAFQSEGLIKLLEALFDKFVQERMVLQREEVNAKHTFKLLIQDLNDQTKRATADRSDKIAIKTDKIKALATAKGNLVEVTKTRIADKKYLKNVVATCKEKLDNFKSRQQLRMEEINAISKAIEIVSSDTVSGSSERHLQSMLEDPDIGALVQLRGRLESTQLTTVLRFLREKALYLGSSELLQLANRMSNDPFKKVRRMISKTLARLMAEANKEAKKKGWCDSELATNKLTRKAKTDAIETLQADIDSLKASMAKRGEEIAATTAELSALEAAVAKATAIRTSEKALNSKAIEDSNAAQIAMSEAISVLKDFYAKADEPAVLLQKEGDPEAPDDPYQGMQEESGGIVGLLEVINSDFARLEAATRSGETEAQQEYDEFMTASKADREIKQTDLEHKIAKQQDASQEIRAKKDDLEDTQGELSAALAYFDKLKPSCVNTGGKYSERGDRRKQELESLKLALRMLNGKDVA